MNCYDEARQTAEDIPFFKAGYGNLKKMGLNITG
ncbi:MAG: hypothetical protein SYNGOMJ08_00356 [Candidatus Syntrophoarchaeum sp. GoM_oil]|nr:MAG: hypothetical protein SYNGOMJ08_00356 [Candidatus Syntrophoarchaeum sp. GoM_oil]